MQNFSTNKYFSAEHNWRKEKENACIESFIWKTNKTERQQTKKKKQTNKKKKKEKNAK